MKPEERKTVTDTLMRDIDLDGMPLDALNREVIDLVLKYHNIRFEIEQVDYEYQKYHLVGDRPENDTEYNRRMELEKSMRARERLRREKRRELKLKKSEPELVQKLAQIKKLQEEVEIIEKGLKKSIG